MRKPKFNEDGSEAVVMSGWAFTAAFINLVAKAAADDGMKPTVWVKFILVKALKERGLWPPA